MKGPRTKRGNKTRLVFIRIGGKTYSVPAQRAKQFRNAMGVAPLQRASMIRNQWDTNPHS